MKTKTKKKTTTKSKIIKQDEEFHTIMAEKTSEKIEGIPTNFGYSIRANKKGTQVVIDHTADEEIKPLNLAMSLVGIAYQINPKAARDAIRNAEKQLIKLSGKGIDFSDIVKNFVENLKRQGIEVQYFSL